VAATAVLGFIGTGLAYLLYFTLIEQLGATRAASVDYLVPVVAVLVGVVTLGEPVSWQLLLGGLLVLAGVAQAQGDHLLRPGRPPRPMPAACVTSES
jgi:drug/metabolite transporter (DMT)-like permease